MDLLTITPQNPLGVSVLSIPAYSAHLSPKNETGVPRKQTLWLPPGDFKVALSTNQQEREESLS